MKIKYIALCLLLVLVGCQRDEEMEVTQLMISNEHIEPSYSSATISCDITSNVTIKQAKVYVSESTDFSSAKTQELSKKNGNTYSAKIDGLSDETTYYVRYQISNRWVSLMAEEIGEFQTTPVRTPTVTTTQPKEITHNSAIMGGKIVDNGGLTITNCGVVYSKSSNPTIENGTKVESNITKEAYTCTLTNLDFTTTYYARAYAVNAKGTAYGEEVSFKTNGTTASLDTLSISDVTATSAVISGALLNNGGESITALGICYGVNQSPTLEDATVVNAELDGLKFSVLLNDLQKGTTYYVRAYVTNSHGTVYSDELYFNTEMTIPTVTTTPATNVSYTSATVGGNVTDNGGANVTERGICYSTSANPTTANTKITSGSGLGQLTCNLTDLQDGTTYYARAYAINAKGIAYGEEVSFTTKAKTIATVVTTPATNVSYTSAIVGGNVTSDGGAEVIERGIVYSTNQNPTAEDSKVTNGSGLGEFTCNLIDLQDATTYYARAYAINEKGTAYGNEVSFTTKGKTIPTVTTNTPSEITYTQAMIQGVVTDDGGASVTEKGVCYSTSPNPTVDSNKRTNGSGIGTITCVFSNLQDGTTYYARAYAINALGVGYGNEVSFTTMAYEVPQITIANPTKYSASTATIDCEVTFDGGLEVTERGVCYSTTSNPTYSSSKVQNGSGLGAYSCELSNLSENTTYYVRAYAKNAEGIGYSRAVQFTTRSRTYMDGYEYVDLGLSVKWASHNIGATRPEDYGYFFAWGETKPKEYYYWNTYKHCRGSDTTLTKYNTEYWRGIVDNKVELEAIDDAAVVNWGGSWRMPTIEEIYELFSECTWESEHINGVSGRRVIGPNGNSIFLPRGGRHIYDSWDYWSGSYGYYWSSSLNYDYDSSQAFGMYFDYYYTQDGWGYGNDQRCEGRSIRPVCP